MKISTIVKTKTGYVWTDTTCLTSNFGNILDALGFGNPDARAGEYETMVFPSDKDGRVKSWLEFDKANYPTEEKAKEGHQKMVKKWEKK